MPSPHQLQHQRHHLRLQGAYAASPMRSECFPGHNPPPPQIRRERGRERQGERETEKERERDSERYSERHIERDRECVRVCLTQSSLPGSSVRATPGTVALQAPLSMGFPRQGNWSGQPFPPLRELLDPGSFLSFLPLAGGFFTTPPPGKSLRTTAGN